MIHVLFSSAAGTLRQVMGDRGRRERVAHFTETLDWGPIGTGNFKDREGWFDLNAPTDFGGWNWLDESVSAFRQKIAANAERLIWVSPRSAEELCGLHWFLAEFGGAGTQMIVADYALQGSWRGQPPLQLGQLQARQIAELLDSCPRIPWNPSQFPEDRWHTLKAEDAMLRIVNGGVLQSARDNYFDEFLLARCSSDWAKVPLIVAHTMGDIGDIGHDAGAELLYWRVRELIQKGEIACDGALPVWPSVSADSPKIRRAADR